jgi:hypothetical protein
MAEIGEPSRSAEGDKAPISDACIATIEPAESTQIGLGRVKKAGVLIGIFQAILWKFAG